MKPDKLLVIDGNQKGLPEKGIEQPVHKPLPADPTDILEIEIVHSAKIREILKKLFHRVTQAYTITEGSAYKRVYIIEARLGNDIITIYQTDTMIEGLSYSEYVPETIRDLKLINKYLDETKKDKPSSEG